MAEESSVIKSLDIPRKGADIKASCLKLNTIKEEELAPQANLQRANGLSPDKRPLRMSKAGASIFGC